MSTAAGILMALLLATMGVSAWTIAAEAQENNRISSEDGSIESRSDYPDFDDMSSFFDFDLVPSSESERDYQNQYTSSGSNSDSPDGRPKRNKYYYYYKADGPRYPESHFEPYPPKKQVVTPGTHYKPETEKDIAENTSESKSTLNQAVVGPYQVSVVDADSPMLSNLGLNKEDLKKLSGYTKRSTKNASMVGSDSVPSATYAENPRQDYSPPNYAPTHSHPHAPHHPPPYETPNQYGGGHTERNYRPSEYYPADNPPPQRGYSSGQPPPQGSYDPKSYQPAHSSSPHSSPNYNYPPPPPPAYNQYPPPASSYAPKRSSEVPWRQSPASHTDWDDKQNKKPEPYHGHSHYQPPPSHSSSTSNSASHYPRPAYSSSDKPGYRYPTYSKPQSTYSSPSSSSSDYHSHKPSSSSSGDHHSHKPIYSSPSYSSPAKAPSRAGSVSYPSSHHHEPSKPGITIRFKGKSPGHGSGLSIPVNFNPLDVVKKLLPSLNPLNNKKVTIGITIENKKEPHIDFQSY